MADIDPDVLSGLLDGWNAFRTLAKGNVPPGAAYWDALADIVAQGTIKYVGLSQVPHPPGDGSTVTADNHPEEGRRRAEWIETIKRLREFDEEAQRHIREIEARRIP